MSALSQAVKRACDACHRRKVKCDGINPCRNCSSAQLSCTYNAVPQKKGPKGSRAKVISELRETQRQTSLSAKVQHRLNGLPCPPAPASLAPGPTPGLLTPELVKDCVHYFFEHLYPHAPVVSRLQVEQSLYLDQNPDAYCLLTSLCAFTMLQPGMSMPPGDLYNLDAVPGANIVSSQLLLEETLRVRKSCDLLDSPTPAALATNFFIFACYFGQEMHERAWYYLREATTLLHLVGMHKEESYAHLDPSDAARRRRIYWLFYVLERAYALHRQRPLSLQASIELPTVNDDPHDPQAHRLHDFLVTLYRPFDDAFTAVWNQTGGQLSTRYLAGLQKQVGDLARSYLCQDPTFNDLHANQQWLKSTAWQLSRCADGSPADDAAAAAFEYPAHLARELAVNMAAQFPVQMDLLGPGLVEKLVETTLAATQYLSSQDPTRDPFATGPQEHLNHLVTIVAMSRHGDHRFLPLLLSKLIDVLPRLASPILHDAPENCKLASVDIFDGFGNAGAAQPPLPMHAVPLHHDDMDHRKFPPVVDDYDKQHYRVEMPGHQSPASATSSSRSTASSSSAPTRHAPSDLSGSYLGSPPILSPSLDYDQNVHGFGCVSIADMVMTSMGGPPPAAPSARTLFAPTTGSAGPPAPAAQHFSPTQPGSLPRHANTFTSPPMQAHHHHHHQPPVGPAAPTAASSQPAPHFRRPTQSHANFPVQQLMSQLQSLNDFQAPQRTPSDASNSLMSMHSMGGIEFSLCNEYSHRSS